MSYHSLIMAKSSPRSIAHSQAAFAKAQQVMPGGVSSPVRAFKAVGGTPVFIREGEGSKIRDIDGNEYIDYVASYGPLIAGHCNEAVVAALSKAIGKGTSFGAPTEQETLLAAMICDAMASVDMIRFVNSGTEATMSALRLARAATGREKIVKCVGCYHGHVDSLLVSAGSGALTLGAPSSPGVPGSVASNTLLVQYNDLAGAKAIFDSYPDQIACFCVEPVPGNMGVILPAEGYLQGLRELCDQNKALLLLDEVMSGFRVAFGGAQERFGVRADLTCLGKVIGGGLPIGAYGGRKDLMEMVSPSGAVYQAGTLSGNPLATTAGLAMIELLREPGVYDQLEARSAHLHEGLARAARKAGVPLAINRCGSMITPFFVKQEGQTGTNFEQATACDTAAYGVFFNAMLERGIYLPPSQFEAWFVGLAHTQDDLDTTIKAAGAAFKQVAAKNGL